MVFALELHRTSEPKGALDPHLRILRPLEMLSYVTRILVPAAVRLIATTSSGVTARVTTYSATGTPAQQEGEGRSAAFASVRLFISLTRCSKQTYERGDAMAAGARFRRCPKDQDSRGAAECWRWTRNSNCSLKERFDSTEAKEEKL